MGINKFCISSVGLCFLLLGCGGSQKSSTDDSGATCAPEYLPLVSGQEGRAEVFFPDPLTSSGDLSLLPNSSRLDDYRTPVSLSRLSGRGVLQGEHVMVLDGVQCSKEGRFGAYSPDNNFVYSHSDKRFQQAMTYYYGDAYRNYLQGTGYLLSTRPTVMLSPCTVEDNAFFARVEGKLGLSNELVCLGTSTRAPGAYYSDDAMAIFHELQHATTANNYSLTQDLNRFEYDEAGALNEGLSDFMALVYTDTITNPAPGLDPSDFSRWALGSFDIVSHTSHARGAHMCPRYDSNYGSCEHPMISFVYPDGLGWPYSGRGEGKNVIQKVFDFYDGQEEVHSADSIILGSLWDIYTSIKSNHGENKEFAARAVTRWVMESVRHLPSPRLRTNASPVTLIQFATQLLQASQNMRELSADDHQAVERVLHARGLYQYPELKGVDWMSVGPGTNSAILSPTTPGVFVANLDVKGRLAFSEDLTPGGTYVVWFDLKNNSEITAGGVLLTVQTDDPEIEILGQSDNPGYSMTAGKAQTQIMYGKVNGKAIVRSLTDQGLKNVGNTYFKTNPRFYRSNTTGLKIKVSENATPDQVVTFHVKAVAANSAAKPEASWERQSSSQDFSLVIQ